MSSFNSRQMLFFLVVLLVTAIDFGAYWALDHIELGSTARIVVALTPLPADIVAIALALRRIRRLDEFQKRIHFEAVTVAFLSTGVAVFVYGYLQKADAAGPLNMGLVWGFMLIFYAVGYFVAVNHYK
jgi:hypothetical protein